VQSISRGDPARVAALRVGVFTGSRLFPTGQIHCHKVLGGSWSARGPAGAARRGRLGRLPWLLVLVLVAGVAHAAPLATLSDDVDGDGVADAIELGADGVVHIAGKPRGEVKVAAAISRGQLAVAHYRGKSYVVAQVVARDLASAS